MGKTACCLAVVWLVGVGLLPVSAWAQEPERPSPVTSAGGVVPREQGRPTTSDRLERILERIGSRQAAEPDGLYPWYGTIFPGGWVGAGPGVRVPFGNDGRMDAHAAVSLKGYTLARATVRLPAFGTRVPRLGFRAEIINARAVAYYGVGNDSSKDDRSSFRLRPFTLGVTALAHPLSGVEVGGALSLMAIDTGEGSRSPGISVRFDERSAPGLPANPRYLVLAAHAAVRPRDTTRYAPVGGTYQVHWNYYRQRHAASLSFQRIDIDLRHVLPLRTRAWVLAVRGAASTTVTPAGNAVPYFLLPDLGGGSSLRSYSNWRFRDRHSALVSVESRWPLSRILDGAVFHDAGRVAATRRGLWAGGVRHATGVGVRLHTATSTLLRVDVATGRDGARLVLATSQSF